MQDPLTPARHSAAEPALDDVRAMFPHWEVWTGIAGLVYARKLLTSPPMVARAENPAGLIASIYAEIGRRSR
jgi:hypothetical protein